MILENAKQQETELTVQETVMEEVPKEIPAELPKKKKSTKKKAAAKPKEEVKETVEEKSNEIDFVSLIAQWKAEYKKIYKNEIDDEIVIWRRLKRGEYKNILAQETNGNDDNPIMTKQEMMVKAAVLYPFDVESLINDNAGVATVLSEEILAKSGFAISYTEEL